jgi:hypothetical protein
MLTVLALTCLISKIFYCQLFIKRKGDRDLTNIEEVLMPGENVIKKQSGVMLGGPGPAGDLHLTNRRLIFLNKKRWSLVSFNPLGSLLGKDILLPLENIREIATTFNGIKVQADKAYQFAVGRFGKREEWANAIQQEKHKMQYPPTQQPSLGPMRTPPPPPPPPNKSSRFCPSCGKPAEFINQYNRWYCRSCQRYL